ncbi:MAG: GreA/GreB family elongation factor [SAR324 cluster bacterium]|nr:GreA/GreB family elongation factor [SAR324 cluster bacterium]
MKLYHDSSEIVVITPASPLGLALTGKMAGDAVTVQTGHSFKEFEVMDLC